MANKLAVFVLSDTDTIEGLGRVVNAMQAVKEYKEAGEEVKFILDGAGTKWAKKFSNPDQNYKELFDQVKDKIGVCGYCAGAFKVKDKVEEQNLPLIDDFNGHPSIKSLLAEGYQVVTF